MQTVNHCECQYWDNETNSIKTEVFYPRQDEQRTYPVLEQVMDWLGDTKNKGSIVIAHCGGAFDFQILYRQFLDASAKHARTKKVKPPLLRGSKIVRAEIHNNILLLDSYAFVTAALAKFPAIFNIEEEKKGFFPHTFNRPEFWKYRGPIPHSDYYEPDTFSPAKRTEFFEWYNEQVRYETIFDFREEMTTYCHSDVNLLRKGMEKLRELFMNLTKADGTPISVDPFNYMTIAGVAFDGIYCTYFLPEETIITVPRPPNENHSFKQILWLEYLADTNPGLFIQHARNVGEKAIPLPSGKTLKVDGFCEATNTVYQFDGCFYHGCPYCYEAVAPTPHRVKTTKGKNGKEVQLPIKFGELYANTEVNTERLRDLGYKVERIWECQWDKLVKLKKINTHRPDLEHKKPLIPREAYFGGRVNAVKLYYQCEGEERIHYMDITSMYPFVMSDPMYDYPIGEPTIFVKGRDVMPDPWLSCDEIGIFGLIKCRIQPPNDLYFPYLPERSLNGKVLFHLNEMIGTWTSVELRCALRLGYKVLDYYEIHHFERRSNTLFREYNETFFEIKRRAKAEGNKGLEAIAKMCINGPTGKWGFNPSKAKATRLVTETDEFFKYLCGTWEEVTLNIINDDVAIAAVAENDEFTEHAKSNVYISAFITAYSRHKLYEEALHPLGERVLYFDTDSVIYYSPTGEHLIPPDTTGAMGLWTSETSVDDYFTEFVSAGPKTYALKSKSGKKDIAKSKGFSLHFKNQQVYNFEALKEQVLIKALNEGAIFPCDLPLEDDFQPPAKKAKLYLHKDEKVMRRKQFHVTVQKYRGKILNLTYDKRVLINPVCDLDQVKCVDTLPHGHKGLIGCEVLA